MTGFARKPLVHRAAGDDVLIGLSDGTYATLQGLAADLWHLLDVPRSESELREILRLLMAQDDQSLDLAIAEGLRQLRPFVRQTDRLTTSMTSIGSTGPVVPEDRALGPGSIDLLVANSTVPAPDAPTLLAAMQWSIGTRWTGSSQVDLSAAHRSARERVVPGLASALRSGGMRPGTGVTGFIERIERDVQWHAIKCEQTLLAVLSELEALGIESRVLKGLATAHLDFTDVELRQIGDVDILAPADEHPAIIERLKALGFSHVVGGDPGPYRLYKSNYLLSPDNIEVDLHHRLFRHGRQPGNAIWEDFDSWTLADTEVRALPRPWRLVHASAHAMFTKERARHLSMYLDAARILMTAPESLDEATSISAALGLGPLFRTGLRKSCSIVGATGAVPDLDFEAGRSIHGSVATWAFGSPRRHRVREQFSLLLGLGGIERIRWMASWISPSSDYTGPSIFERATSSVRSRLRSP